MSGFGRTKGFEYRLGMYWRDELIPVYRQGLVVAEL